MGFQNSVANERAHEARVGEYIRYHNLERLHTVNGNQSPISYENSLKNVSGWS
ncbi:IS3 family transposase [Oleiphilus sp. HI0125]|uniref:IS3 family transposase n=1 Tax=Oleiphilus sp. HI0125 TaxID=1822266 RepID=UPI0012E986DF